MTGQTCLPERAVVFDGYPDSARRYLDCDAIICISTLLQTTILVTAANVGRRLLLAADRQEAERLARGLSNPLVMRTPGPDTAARAGVAAVTNLVGLGRFEPHRPLLLVCAETARLLRNAGDCPYIYLVCLRNLTATAEWVAQRHRRVAVLAPCEHGQLRVEDRLVPARFLGSLSKHAFAPVNMRARELVRSWSGADLSLLKMSRTVEQLRREGLDEDVDFVLKHVDDLDDVVMYDKHELWLSRETSAA